MTTIRVNPASVKSYGNSATAIFASVSHDLQSMVTETVEVHYFGPNSVQFKTECGRLASEFANALHKDMAAIADAVRLSTSNIATALGGTTISIVVDNKPITPPAPKAVDYVDVNTEALEGLVPTVNKHFDAIRSGLDKHLADLKATDWQGQAKESAVGAVSTFTNSAKGRCDEAQKSIVKFITDQVNAVKAADK
ncbi:MAG: hypothetical protein ACOYN3_06265 [Acidimicrobiia bacterium]